MNSAEEKKEITNGVKDNHFFKDVLKVLHNAQKAAQTAVNLSMVYAYFEIGRMIVEEEQKGNARADYGKHLIEDLSRYLTEEFGKGYSVGNLKNIRQFYKVYSKDQIGETVFSQFKNPPVEGSGGRRP